MAKKDKSKTAEPVDPKKRKSGKGKAGKSILKPVPEIIEEPIPIEVPKKQYPINIPLPHPMPMLNVNAPQDDYRTLHRLFKHAFLCVERVICHTPSTKCIVFEIKCRGQTFYKLYDGCVCNPMRFRYYNVYQEDSDLKFFPNMHELLKYILDIKAYKTHLPKLITISE